MQQSKQEKQGSRGGEGQDKNQKPGTSGGDRDSKQQQKDKIEKPLKTKTAKGKSTFMCAGMD